MSAWEIYWVLQLDSINSALVWFPFAASVVVLTLTITSDGEIVCDTNAEQFNFYRWVYWFLAYIALSWTAAVFLPSTKTAAAMVVVPAITNNETVQREAGELYQLAKDALRDAIKPEKQK